MDKCIFCNIIQGKEPCFKVFENDQFIAFLDKRPVFHGHCLVLPKQHIHTLYDLPETHSISLLQLIQKIGRAVEKSMNAAGTFIAINNKISQSVPHLHVHIVPRNAKDGLKGFFWPRTHYANEDEIRAIQLKIAAAIHES